MKSLFKGFYRLENDDFVALWDNAVFIFDTNVLLNLYRYQSSTRDALLQVMEKLADRAWLPYHVGLEYQRNRLTVIAEQHKRFSEVKNIVEGAVAGMRNEFDALQLKKRHSHIDPDNLLSKFDEIRKSFVDELNLLESNSISVNSDDEIRNRIDALFDGRIGSPPEKQSEMDEIFKDGELRYKNNIPPGFKDSAKDDKKPDEFTYAGITYKRKYGDLIIWKQIINHAKENQIKDVVFVTDDSKSDWWWKVDSNGKKTIGVRPELTDEISREAGVQKFHVYNTESFLSFANEKLNAQVTEEAIEEVREVSVNRRAMAMRNVRMHELGISAEIAVYEWLSSSFQSLEHNSIGFPDFVGYQNELKFGFEVKLLKRNKNIINRLNEDIYRAYHMLKEQNFHEFAIVLVVLEEDALHEVLHRIRRRLPEMDGNLRIVVGKAEYDEEEGYVYGFTPYDDIHISGHM
ncbi:PIN domain-containing protein [Alloalcanivorax venustensis]|uniref:PIN domain-containing protein n=1 Tax=Alloalcanivorax venustensis TaxID=172371 RepID=UPI0035167677